MKYVNFYGGNNSFPGWYDFGEFIKYPKNTLDCFLDSVLKDIILENAEYYNIKEGWWGRWEEITEEEYYKEMGD